MQKSIKLIALITFFYVYNVHTMDLATERYTHDAIQKAIMFEESLYTRPSCTLEMTTQFIKTFPLEINQVDTETGNTPLHTEVIQICWGCRPARLIALAALINCGANRSAVNKEGLTPLGCAEYAVSEAKQSKNLDFVALCTATAELLKEPNPSKDTLVTLVKKYRQLSTLNPLLHVQQPHLQ